MMGKLREVLEMSLMSAIHFECELRSLADLCRAHYDRQLRKFRYLIESIYE